jgi:hypothetical protein
MQFGERQLFMLEDVKVPVKLKLSALWAALMFCYLYGDYFGLYVPGQLQGMLTGGGPIGPTTERSLVAVSVLMVIPSLMVFLAVGLRPQISRWTNIGLAAFYALVVAVTMPGSWAFYLMFSTVEIALSLMIIWCAWIWPKASSTAPSTA